VKGGFFVRLSATLGMRYWDARPAGSMKERASPPYGPF
jgi:hypothetical protein